jgi:glycosyltransferase involved in cell wall biosynthesis
MISILIPIYNGIEFITESVQSVLIQSYQDWELLIGVNGHNQNSEVYQKAKLYESLDKRIKVFDFYNIKGKSNTLNEMIKHCSYNFVALLDVDDIWNYKKLEIQSKFLSDYDVIGSNCVWFGDIENVVPKIPVNDFSSFNFIEVNPIINSSCIIKKELCYWNENGIEDYDLWLRLWKQKKRFFNCPEILVKHRIHRTSAFNSKGNNDKVTPLLASHGFRREENINTYMKEVKNVQKINMNIF